MSLILSAVPSACATPASRQVGLWEVLSGQQVRLARDEDGYMALSNIHHHLRFG